MPEVSGFHELRARNAGEDVYLEMHLEIHSGVSFEKSHECVVFLTEKLQQEHPELRVIIHADPVSRPEAEKS